MKITKVQRTGEGYWTARVGGVPVDNRFGCWGTPPDGDGRWRTVTPQVAARLQAKVRRAQKGEVVA